MCGLPKQTTVGVLACKQNATQSEALEKVLFAGENENLASKLTQVGFVLLCARLSFNRPDAATESERCN